VVEIGLFPLGIVLLPTERIPLHIFEPRYRELIGECLDEERDFGLLLADDDGLREVGTRASVIEVLQEFEDGRLNVVVEGRERFRLVELTAGRSFQTGEVEPVEDEDEDDPPTLAEREQALELFRRLAETAEAEVDIPEGDTEILSFELAARIDFGADLKQELLELRSERARLRRLAELMERATQAIAVERDVRERASGNGKVAFP
jgi:Lon protease-like protein